MRKKLVVLTMLLLSGIVLSACSNPNKLSGDYTGTISMLFMSKEDTLRFSGENVIEIADGHENNIGTYKISGNELEITDSDKGFKMVAELSDDRKTLTIKSATGISSLATGTKYKKK